LEEESLPWKQLERTKSQGVFNDSGHACVPDKLGMHPGRSRG
jgi:hypothetical protein